MFAPGDVIRDRFEIVEKIADGGMGVTYLCTDSANGARVALKCLGMERLKDWKSMDLFKREARVLKSIHHEFIPRYIDFFEYGKGEDLSFVLIQEFIQGANLQKKIDEGWRADESEITAIAIRLLSIVDYLHSLKPPVIHRDINPKNIIMSDDGNLYLVDFGCVQDRIRGELERRSTFVGTPGYTPIEQFQGHATGRSDLYAVAATLLYLLTHREVTDLATDGLKPDVKKYVRSEALAAVLSNYLEPDQSNRDIGASQAIDILEGKSFVRKEKSHGPLTTAFISLLEEVKSVASKPDVTADDKILEDPGMPPAGSSIQLTKKRGSLEIGIGRGSRGKIMPGLSVVAVSIFFLTFVIPLVLIDVKETSLSPFSPFLFFIIPLWATGLILCFIELFNKFGKTTLFLKKKADGFLKKELIVKKIRNFKTSDITECKLTIAYILNRSPIYQCTLVTTRGNHSFGQKLTNAEKKWICDTVNYWIRDLKDT